MAGAREDDLESKLGGMLLLDKKKLSSTKKSSFRWETVNVVKKGLKGYGEKPGRARQVKANDKVIC